MAQSGDILPAASISWRQSRAHMSTTKGDYFLIHAWGAFVAGPVNGDDERCPFPSHVDRSRPGKFISERLCIIINGGDCLSRFAPVSSSSGFSQSPQLFEEAFNGLSTSAVHEEGGALESIIHVGLSVFLPLILQLCLVGRGWGGISGSVSARERAASDGRNYHIAGGNLSFCAATMTTIQGEIENCGLI